MGFNSAFKVLRLFTITLIVFLLLDSMSGFPNKPRDRDSELTATTFRTYNEMFWRKRTTFIPESSDTVRVVLELRPD